MYLIFIVELMKEKVTTRDPATSHQPNVDRAINKPATSEQQFVNGYENPPIYWEFLFFGAY